MSDHYISERPERDNAPARQPLKKSMPAPSYYKESEADSPAVRRAQRYKAEVTLRQFAAERAARQAERGEASPKAPLPTSTLARQLQEGPGDQVAAALMRQFAAERVAREAEADASSLPIPLRRRAAEAGEAAGGVQRVETPDGGPRRTEEDGVAGSARLSAGVPAVAVSEPASVSLAAAEAASPLVERMAEDTAPGEGETLHRPGEAHPRSADGGAVSPGANGLQRPAAPPVGSPSGLAPLIIPSTSRQMDILRARGDCPP